ncbi:MAG: MarR family transcriptional regulator [Candidatus Cloacimonadales bacterium]
MNKKFVKELGEISSELYNLCSKKELTRRKCLNLGKMECDLLFFLAGIGKPLCMNDLSENMGVSNSRITRIVDNLVYKKYVRRFPSEKDRRSWLAELTKEGIAANQRSVDEFLGIQVDILNELPEEKISSIIESVNIYIDSYKAALRKKEESL